MTGRLYPVSIDRRVRVAMDDGVELALTVYLPDAPGDGPFPAVVESIPYRKDDDCFARDWANYTYLAERGFAGVRIDIRGTGASDGVIVDEYVEREQIDTRAVLQWAAAQEWCTGRLGMWGISWGGFAALQTAMLRPPELQAIVAAHATHDRFACDVHYLGGALHCWEQVDWPVGMVALNALPPDPDLVGETWKERWRERLELTPQWLPGWLARQSRDPFWRHGSPCEDYQAITVPTLLIGGWLDGYIDGILAMLEALPGPKRAIVGPWGHFRPATGVPGPTYDHLREMVRWFGHWLRDDPNGVPDDPLLTVFIRTGPPFDPPTGAVAGFWREESSWPPADREELVWQLGEGGTLVEQAAADGFDEWTGPAGTGSYTPFWDMAGWGSGDTTMDDASALSYETGPLTMPVEVLGAPKVQVSISVDRPYGLVAAHLVDVGPDGAAALVTRGVLNLSHVDGSEKPAPPPVGTPFAVEVPLRETSLVVPAGHRIRLSLAGADFPLIWPPPTPVTLRIHRGTDHPARLVLPVVPLAHRARRVDVPPGVPPMAPIVERPGRRSWQRRRTGSTVEVTRSVASWERILERGQLTYASSHEMGCSIRDDDPASCRAFGEARLVLSRPGWEVATTGRVDLRTDGARFLLDIDLAAHHGSELVFSRRWRTEIDREWA